MNLSWKDGPGRLVIGHRGFPGQARENTPDSFRLALEAGAHGVELDVRLTEDDIPVVHHDETALGDRGAVNLTRTAWDVLAGERFRGQEGIYCVHRLDEVIRPLAGTGLLNIEVKPPAEDRREATARAVGEALSGVEPRASVLVSSFDAPFLATLAGVEPSLDLALLLGRHGGEQELARARDLKRLAALHPRHDLVTETLMGEAREHGWMVNSWTVDDPQQAERLWSLGVRAVITNRPDRLA